MPASPKAKQEKLNIHVIYCTEEPDFNLVLDAAGVTSWCDSAPQENFTRSRWRC